jgi:LPLT family lysophospholipid transporter-like MFS transporter
VQNFNENASVLVMLAVYAGLLAAQWDIRSLMSGLGLFVAASVAVLWWWERRLRRMARTA